MRVRGEGISLEKTTSERHKSYGDSQMLKLQQIVNLVVIATIACTAVESARAQSWGGFGINVGGHQVRIGTPSRSSNRTYKPNKSFSNQSRKSNSFQRVVQNAVEHAATDAVRQLTSSGSRHGKSPITDHRFRPGSEKPVIRISLGGLGIQHAAAFAKAVTAHRGRCEYRNPYCGTRPPCTRPCPSQGGSPTQFSPERNFELARHYFRCGEYGRALHFVDQAITQVPDEPELFQFRSLVLFAMGEYLPAADAAYTALSAGPGWNWETLYGFYGNAERYTQHLRRLEAATKANPNSPGHHFLTAYHYLMLNQVEAGRDKLERVLELEPNDALTKDLLAILPNSN
jgi:hypothetical protein